MRILVVAPHASPIVQRLLYHLKRQGHVVLLASHNIVADQEKGVVNLGRLTSFLSYFNVFKINRIVQDFQPDVVHAHVVNHYGLMAMLQPKPLVVALWGSEIMLAPHDRSRVKRRLFRLLNRLVLQRANRCHTSALHVAEEAERQCQGVLQKTDVFYWGFPLHQPDAHTLAMIAENMQHEFGLTGSGFIVFPRGLASVYCPDQVLRIIQRLQSCADIQQKIVVLKGFASDHDADNFLSQIDVNRIIYINRLLSSAELYYLYSHSHAHVSIPHSDSLGGGVVEPALLGSYPILSDLPSYRAYAAEYPALILKDYSESSLDMLCEAIMAHSEAKRSANIPAAYDLDAVLGHFAITFAQAINHK